MSYDGTPNPTKAHCNNCGATIKYNPAKKPVSLLCTLSDSLGAEVYYCPNCGPNSADAYDGVEVVST